MDKKFRLADLLPAHPMGVVQVIPILPKLRVDPDQWILEKHPPIDLPEIFQPVESLSVADHRVPVEEHEGASGRGDVLRGRNEVDDFTLGWAFGMVPLWLQKSLGDRGAK